MRKDRKNAILDSWIMVERLSEGDIKRRSSAILTLQDLRDGDFYSCFKSLMQKRHAATARHGGIVAYVGVFAFKEMTSLLRTAYGLKETNEDVCSGDKFHLALYFDKNLNLDGDKTFLTESGYILRNRGKVPDIGQFDTYEAERKTELKQKFDGTADDQSAFNAAILSVMDDLGVSLEECCLQVVHNLESDATNLHSFFLDDLQKAKGLSTDNLDLYLSAGNAAGRVNLDSKSDSVHFNPHVFEDILQPKNYPLGRFPSTTEHVLSLMQQVAVNLATGYDDRQMRSVNGPPGTGKTTLLKDIFAELIVQQAHDIAELSRHQIKGTESTRYYNDASIGVIPRHVVESGIVVASSNNGAVQNIVNELPLVKEIDDRLLEELREADYFREISNSKSFRDWEGGTEEGHREKPVHQTNEGESCWGLFSLEGGRATNMTNIVTNVKHVLEYLQNDYMPDEDVYEAFLEQYGQVESMRSDVQALADKATAYEHDLRSLDQLSEERIATLAQQDDERRRLGEARRRGLDDWEARRDGLQRELEGTRVQEQALSQKLSEARRERDAFTTQRPGLFAGRAIRGDYRRGLADRNDQVAAINVEWQACIDREAAEKIALDRLNAEPASFDARQAQQERHFSAKMDELERQIAAVRRRIGTYEGAVRRQGIVPLDMSRPYDDLQMSNPWFGRDYRISQSRLFIMALRVRKQFLYDNRRNVRAAVNIWEHQSQCARKNKQLIGVAFNWIHMVIPVISSTFASFSRMCANLGANSLGHLFVDEAGQALPQASVGAILRSRHVMAVGDPLQIKPVLTLDSNVLGLLGERFGVTERYLSDSASTQTLVDSASRYGFYREKDESDDSWIGIPLWVHRRCHYPMFTISNRISYGGLMVQANRDGFGKTGWYDVSGKADDKYVREQGEFLSRRIKELMEKDPRVGDEDEKDIVYVITPFANVARHLSQKLWKIGFTRYDDSGRPTNVGTIHTFQGKEAPVVFMVLGADQSSKGAAGWAVREPNMMNVAATRAKEEFYVIGDKELYLSIGSDVATETYRVMREYKAEHPEKVDEDVSIGEGTTGRGTQGGPLDDGDASAEHVRAGQAAKKSTESHSTMTAAGGVVADAVLQASVQETYSWGRACSLFGRDKLGPQIRNSTSANRLLESAGWIERVDDGWRSTDRGRALGISCGSYDGKPRCKYTMRVFGELVALLQDANPGG